MIFVTHLASGFLASLLVSGFLSPKYPAVFIIVMCLASVLPDIDYSKSKVGRKFGFISKALQFVFGHRGFMHTLYVPAIVFLACLLLDIHTIGFAFLFGYLVHIFTDALTVSGVRLFSPVSEFQLRGFIRTGGFLEYVFLVIVAAATVVMLLF
ncbi:MAG: metal-dependent hydrolase [Candidatus Woesearchaeota archaeon]